MPEAKCIDQINGVSGKIKTATTRVCFLKFRNSFLFFEGLFFNLIVLAL
jgi:hypothetical protein